MIFQIASSSPTPGPALGRTTRRISPASAWQTRSECAGNNRFACRFTDWFEERLLNAFGCTALQAIQDFMLVLDTFANPFDANGF